MPPILRVNQHHKPLPAFRDAAQSPADERLTIHRLAHDDLGAAAGEAPIIVDHAQRPVQSW